MLVLLSGKFFVESTLFLDRSSHSVTMDGERTFHRIYFKETGVSLYHPTEDGRRRRDVVVSKSVIKGGGALATSYFLLAAPAMSCKDANSRKQAGHNAVSRGHHARTTRIALLLRFAPLFRTPFQRLAKSMSPL